jgi:hypothetical protein
VPRKLIVDLIPPLCEFIRLELGPDRLLGVIVTNLTMTVEAERDGIVLIIASGRVDVVHLDENIACLLAEAAVPITPE